MFALLLPPSVGQAPGGDLPGWDLTDGRFGAQLAAPRIKVARALRRAKGGTHKQLGVGGANLERALQANRTLVGAATLPAWRRFTGVVWDHLDIASLSAAGRERASHSVIIMSAVAGLLALDDPIADHRVNFGVRLAPIGLLAAFWRGPLSTVLNDHLEGKLVVDLLPAEHRAAWVSDPDRYDLRRVRLVSRDGRVAGHAAKAAKGLLARSLVESSDPSQALARWHHDDFTLEIADSC